MIVRRIPALLGLICLLAFAPAPTAQQEPVPPDSEQAQAATVRIDDLEALVEDIEDPARRARLVERLRTLIDVAREPQAPPAGKNEPPAIELVIAFFRGLGDQAAATASNVIHQVSRVPARIREISGQLAEPARRSNLLEQAARAGGIVLVSLLMQALAWFAVQRPRRRLTVLDRDKQLRTWPRTWRLLVRLLLDLVPPIVAMAVVFVGLSAVPLDTGAAALALAIVTATALRSVVRAAVHGVLAPRTPDLRLLRVTDEAAGSLAGSVRRAGATALYGWFAIVAIEALLGDAMLTQALTSLYALTLLVIGTMLVLRYRNWPASPSPSMKAADPPPAAGRAQPTRPAVHSVARKFGRLWWIAALLYLFGLYTLWMNGQSGSFLTALQATVKSVVVLVLAVLLHLLATSGLERLSARLLSAIELLPTIRRRVPGYVRAARFVAGVVIGIVAAGFIFEAWGIGALDNLQATLVQAIVKTGLGILTVLVLAVLVIDVTTAVTESYLRRKEVEVENPGKVRTLVPLAQKAVRFVVWTLAGITLLGQLGVSLGPILASIGVLGLAVGFGAQTLVKDVITGVFILLEDAVSVGDIVKIDGTGGVVEEINIRTIRLRDLSGNVHTIPYSTVGQFANLTKEFSCYLIECGVAYREDVDEVITVLRELGAEMQADRDFGPNILEPIEIMGLDRFEDSAVIVRARLKTKPSKQWSTGREFNRRMKRTFDERGIEIPFPHRTVYIGEDKEGRSPPLNLVMPDGALTDGAAGPSRQPDRSVVSGRPTTR